MLGWCCWQVLDPYWEDVSQFEYQELQPHQAAIIERCEGVLQQLRQKTSTRSDASSS